MALRFKTRVAKVLVIGPDNRAEQRDITMAYDGANKMFGIQLKGYTFFVSQTDLRLTRDAGTPSAKLPRVV